MIQSDAVDATLSVNLKSVIYLTQSASRLMIRGGGGSIINISSIMGRFGNKGQLVYSSSKAGIMGYPFFCKRTCFKKYKVNAIAGLLAQT